MLKRIKAGNIGIREKIKNNGIKLKVVFMFLIHYFYDRKQQINRIIKVEPLQILFLLYFQFIKTTIFYVHNKIT